MINIFLTNPSAANQSNDEVPCFRVPKHQKMEPLVQFFESLGFKVGYSAEPKGEAFLTVKDGLDQEVATILISGSHLGLVQ